MPETAFLPPILASCARGFGTAVLVASLFVFALALPPAALGIWFQTEPVTAGLLAIGAAAGIALITLDLTGHPVGLLLGRTHVQILFAFLAWNAVVSLAQDFPARGWFGTPESGEGIFSFMAMALLLLLAMALWPHRRPRQVIATAALISALTLGGLQGVSSLDPAWHPAKYAGYAGIVGPPLLLIVAGSARRFSWRVLLCGWLGGLGVLAFSGNKTAIALFCLAGPLLGAALAPLAARWRIERARFVLGWLPVLAVILSILLTSVTVAAARAYGVYDPLYSVWSRGLLILAAGEGILGQLSSLAVGFGWGSYNDILFQHSFVPGVVGFRNGVWNPNWEALGPGAFHVHNDILEAVLGGGVISGALYLAFFVSVVAGSRRRILPTAGAMWFAIVGSLCFWYPFLLALPFLAVAVAAGTAPLGLLRGPYDYRLGWWGRGGAVAMSFALAAGAAMTLQDARMGAERVAALVRQDPAEIPVLGAFPPDHGRGGVHVWWLALNEAAFLNDEMAAGRQVTPAQAQWYGRLLQEADAWAATGRAGTRLDALTLALRNDLGTMHEQTALAPLRAKEMQRWPEAARRIAGRYPDRADVVVPYLLYLATHNALEAVNQFCGPILAVRPTERVCLWYTGFAMLPDPATVAVGLARMHTALRAGVAAVVPVPDAARTMIEANVPGGAR